MDIDCLYHIYKYIHLYTLSLSFSSSFSFTRNTPSTHPSFLFSRFFFLIARVLDYVYGFLATGLRGVGRGGGLLGWVARGELFG